MSETPEPSRLSGDHRLILESSRLTRDLSDEAVERVRTALVRSRFRLKGSAERIIQSGVDATNKRLRKEKPASQNDA